MWDTNTFLVLRYQQPAPIDHSSPIQWLQSTIIASSHEICSSSLKYHKNLTQMTAAHDSGADDQIIWKRYKCSCTGRFYWRLQLFSWVDKMSVVEWSDKKIVWLRIVIVICQHWAELLMLDAELMRPGEKQRKCCVGVSRSSSSSSASAVRISLWVKNICTKSRIEIW